MYYYAFSLRKADFLMVNSSWTKNHVDSILRHTDPILDLLHVLPSLAFSRTRPTTAQIVYPPCDTRAVSGFPLNGRERIILSVAQFRPEKDHVTQLRSFAKLLQIHPEYASGPDSIRLVLIGGSRNAGDAARVDALRELSRQLGIEDRAEFVINASYPVVLDWLRRSSIGFSTMVDEHFGINVVEFMAAGVIPVAHASGGPVQDIIVPYNGEPTGFHARDPGSFADALHQALSLSKAEESAIRRRARQWAVQRFSEEEFVKGWNASGWQKYLAIS